MTSCEREGLLREELAKLSRTDKLKLPISDLGLSVRTTNTLETGQVFTVDDLLNLSLDRLRGFSNIGEKTEAEIFMSLARFGFYRKGHGSLPDSGARAEGRRREFRKEYGVFGE